MSRIGVIDIGTVTARLAISKIEGGTVAMMSRKSVICNLGEGVDKTRVLHPDAMSRVLACCRDYLSLMAEADVDAVCVTLTSAARDASNGPKFVESLRELGLAPQIIPGEVEGMLTFWGVGQDFGEKRILVCDSGGGSTELVIGSLQRGLPELEYVRSINMGCRRLTERHLELSDPPSSSQIEEARRACAQAFLAESFDKPDLLVAVAGTVTTLVAMSCELDPYDSEFVHLHDLKLNEVKRLIEVMAAKPLLERAQLIGLQAQRAPVILGGAIIIEQIMETFGYESLIVSENDLLLGLSLASSAQLEKTRPTQSWLPLISRPDFV